MTEHSEAPGGSPASPVLSSPVLRSTVLVELHRAAGARMAQFGDWLMPIEYPGGTLAEHAAVRGDVGIFDVSHMGRLVVSGPGSVAGLNTILANDLERIGPGRAQYTLVCNGSGGVIDDLIAYRISDDEVRLVPNAANSSAVAAALRAGLPGEVILADRQDSEGIIAVQGPRSGRLLASLGLLPDPDLPYMAFTDAQFGGEQVLVARSGYTGELGYELIAPVGILPDLWESLAAGGATPCGLGARDTLRTEMGYPLHGQDIAPDITPLEAGLSWAIGWDKPEFAGRAALLEQRAAGRRRALRGLRLLGRGVPRPEMEVVAEPLAPEGRPAIGVVTSGTFSPTLKVGIALALVDPGVAFGDQVGVVIRSRVVPAQVVRTPFVDASPK